MSQLTSQQKHDQHEDARIAVATLARQESRAREQGREEAKEAFLRPYVESPHKYGSPIVHQRDHTVVVGRMDCPWQRITDEYDGTCTA